MKPPICHRAFHALLLVPAALALLSAQSVPAPRLVPLVEDLGADAMMLARASSGLVYFSTTDAIRCYDPARHTSFLIDSAPAADLAVSKQGDRLAFARGSPWLAIWVLQLDPVTGHAVEPPRRLSVSSGRGPAFSPDGRFVAFSVLPANDTLVSPRVVRVPVAGGPEQVLTREPGFAQTLRWSRDGEWIYYRHGVATQAGQLRTLRRVRAVGGVPETLTRIGEFVGLSPDGRLLAYVENLHFHKDVELTFVIADARGHELRRFKISDAKPIGWGPKPQQLLVRREHASGRAGVRFMDLNGHVRDVAPAPASGGLTMMLPDAKSLLDVGTGSGQQLAQCQAILAIREDSTAVCLARGTGTHEVRSVSLKDGAKTVIRTVTLPEQYRPGIQMAGADRLVLVFGGRVMTTPLTGGAIKTVYQVANGERLYTENVGTSPAGDWVAVVSSIKRGGADAQFLRLVSLKTDVVRSLRLQLPSSVFVSGMPIWDPSSRYIAIDAEEGGRGDAWIIPLNGDRPFPLTRSDSLYAGGFTLTHDGSGLIYRYWTGSATSSLWTVDFSRLLATTSPRRSR